MAKSNENVQPDNDRDDTDQRNGELADGERDGQPVDEPVVVPSGPAARVADSYGADPNEHKPSQDPWVADEADEKQAETGGVTVAPAAGEEESSPGENSSPSESSNADTKTTSRSDSSRPARTTESRTQPDPTGSSSADSTGTSRRKSSN